MSPRAFTFSRTMENCSRSMPKSGCRDARERVLNAVCILVDLNALRQTQTSTITQFIMLPITAEHNFLEHGNRVDWLAND